MKTEADIPLSPEMAALATDRQRAFVLALFDAPQKRGRQSWAARAAGYGTATSSAKSLGVIAARLIADDKIQAAIAAESRRQLRAIPPAAVAALARLVDKPGHKDHARAIDMVLSRTDPVETRHNVVVEHDHRIAPATIADCQKQIAEIARRVGVPALAGPVIDAEFTEVERS